MIKKDFKNIYVLFLVILFLIPIGFKKYFSQIFSREEFILTIDLHAFTMSVWCILLVVQPLLIFAKKYSLHRTIGNISFWMMPIVIIFMYLTVGRPLVNGHSPVVANIFMPFAHMVIFLLFYILAIKNKSRREIHLRYIVISSLSLLGPTIGRINFGVLSEIKGGFELLVIDLILILFLIIDIYKKRNIKPFLLGLIVYLLVHIFSMTFAYTIAWQNISKVLYPYI